MVSETLLDNLRRLSKTGLMKLPLPWFPRIYTRLRFIHFCYVVYYVPGTVTLETKRWSTQQQSPGNIQVLGCSYFLRSNCILVSPLNTWNIRVFFGKNLRVFLLLVTKGVLLNTNMKISRIWKETGIQIYQTRSRGKDILKSAFPSFFLWLFLYHEIPQGNIAFIAEFV